ncbi:Drug/Metabolite Transporter (DMT) Superfamily [Planoprotostelium fungivorum]|uniref:Drug/Metabolite Transporter (DMT) Superfamily n=1 Tax=Planoprotostelium fungivorum TaxID=1890364 RepID=A0A2P6MM66_9EUKA|nr:Drug/Metabolite Transporter (DMT) Superfamily [Planoprotostelium fungivorum]
MAKQIPEEVGEQQPLLLDASAVDAQTKADNAAKSKMLLISFLLMVVVGLGNKVLSKLQTIPMQNYPYFQSLWTTFVYIPLSFAYIWPMIRYGSLITREQRAIPWYKFAVMGVLDGIAGIMQSFATNAITSGPLIILILQSAIPVSMVISKFLLKVTVPHKKRNSPVQAKYEWQHYVGAVIVIIGLVIVIVLPLVTEKGGTDTGDKMTLVWCGVLILSCIPMTLSTVYKEKALGETEIDVVYLNGWVAIWQFLVLLPLAVPAGYANNLHPQQIPGNFWDGVKCYVGKNSVVGGDKPDDCHLAPVLVNLYILFNVLYNILIIMILKYGSANLLWLAMTIIVPLSNVTFALPIPGHVDFKFSDVVGLVVIMIGLVVFRFWGKVWDIATFTFKYLFGGFPDKVDQDVTQEAYVN